MTQADRIETPAGFVRWTAADKHDWLWDTLVSPLPDGDNQLPPLVLPGQQRPLTELGIVLRKAQLEKAMSHPFDVMEPRRPKVIHARGAVAMVELVTDESSPFTGLLGPPSDGGAIGLIRMSLVQKPSRKKSYTPAFGLKLLIDGHASADLLAMNHTVGQGRDFDVFSNTMTHDLSETHHELRTAQKVMAKLFARVSEEPRRLTIGHLADRRRDGTAVEGPRTPDRLIFRPTDGAKAIFAGKAGVDFRRVLAGVAPNTELYKVESVKVPREKAPSIRFGVLRTTTPFVSSPGGDRLFFRHVQDH